MSRPAPTDVYGDVKAIYAELESRPIERNCTTLTGCCRFKLTGETPYLTKAEALVAARAWRDLGRGKLPKPGSDGACPMLDNATGRCRIYESRPFGCRTHFCRAAGGSYPRRQVVDLIHRLEDLSRSLGQDEARPLQAAVEDALRDPTPHGIPSKPYRRY